MTFRRRDAMPEDLAKLFADLGVHRDILDAWEEFDLTGIVRIGDDKYAWEPTGPGWQQTI